MHTQFTHRLSCLCHVYVMSNITFDVLLDDLWRKTAKIFRVGHETSVGFGLRIYVDCKAISSHTLSET